MSSSADPHPSDPPTFTSMIGDPDVDFIGAHCQHAYCGQLDFLPFRCESCRNTYCLDHRTETAHSCSHAGEWAKRRQQQNASPSSTTSTTLSGKPTLQTGTQCSHPSCKTYINTLSGVGVGCATCNREFCLKHRLREDHACATLKPLGTRTSLSTQLQQQQAQNMNKAKNALSRLKAWSKTNTPSLPKPAPSQAAQSVAALNTLKRNAKGDAKVPTEMRIYLHVEAEAKTTQSKFPRGEFWYSREWSVGRALDEAAKGLQVVNVNNRGGGEEERLRVFHVEGGRVLGFGEKMGEVCANANTIVLLRGIGLSS